MTGCGTLPRCGGAGAGACASGGTRLSAAQAPLPRLLLTLLRLQRVAKALLFSLRGNGQSAAGALGGALFTEGALVAAEGAVAPAPAESAALSGSEDSEDVFELTAGGAGGDGHGLVVVRRIDIFSTSEEDLQPFFGHCHVAYLPAHGRLVGLSKTARIAEVFARRLQTPQRLAEELAVRFPLSNSRIKRLTSPSLSRRDWRRWRSPEASPCCWRRPRCATSPAAPPPRAARAAAASTPLAEAVS